MRVIIRIPSFSCSKNVINIHFLQVENSLDYHTAHCQLVNRYKFRSLSRVLATLQVRQDNFGWWSKLESSQRARSLSTLGFYEDWLLNDKFLAMKNIMNLQLGIFSVSFFKEFLSTKLQDCSKFFFVKWITPEEKNNVCEKRKVKRLFKMQFIVCWARIGLQQGSLISE